MTALKGDQHRDDVTVGKRRFPVPSVAITGIELMFFNFKIKFLAKVININKNFDNFTYEHWVMLRSFHGRFTNFCYPFKHLFLLIRLLLQSLIGVESTKDIPEQAPKQQVLRKMFIGISTL